MRAMDATWKSLVAGEHFSMETVAVINGVEYSTITAPTRENALLSGEKLSVGNCICTTVEFSIMTTDTIPKSASVVLKSRLTDGTTHSGWFEFGTYYISHRVQNDDMIDLVCYDSMMMGRQVYVDTDQAMNWPKSMSTVVQRIAQQMGVQIDSRTVINTGSAYNTVTKPAEDDSLLDILGRIGAIHGGNWTITPENKLRLIPICSPPADKYNIIDEYRNEIETASGDQLVWNIGSGGSNVHPAGGGLLDVPIVIGSITTATPYIVSRVTMSWDETHVYTAGNDSGYNLVIENNPYVSQALCDALIQQVSGVEYVPFALTNAIYDPAVELGDWVIVGDIIRGVLYSETALHDVTFSATAMAPGKDEAEEEYPFKSPLAKMRYELDTVQVDNAVLHSEINQMPDSIMTRVSATYATQNSVTELSSEIQQTQSAISLKVGYDDVIASINASVEQSGGSYVTINASKVNLSGYVTVSALSGNGTTTINGGNITTGIIKDANNNTSFNLSTGELSIRSGSINLGSGNFVVTSGGSLTAVGADISGTFLSTGRREIGNTGVYETVKVQIDTGVLSMFRDSYRLGNIYGSESAFHIDGLGNYLYIDNDNVELRMGQSELSILASDIIIRQSTSDLPAYGYTGTLNRLEFICGICVGSS